MPQPVSQTETVTFPSPGSLRQRDCAARGRKLDGVGRQIRPNQFQKPRVCLDDSAVLQICHKFNALFLPGIFKLQCALTQLLAKVIRLRHRANCLFFQLVQLEDIGDEV